MKMPASPTVRPASRNLTRWRELAAEGLITGIPSIPVPGNRSHSFPRLHRLGAFRLGTVFEIAMVSARIRRQLPDAQRAGAASHAAFHRIDHAQQLLEHGAQQYLYLQSDLARHSRFSMPACCTSPRRVIPISVSRCISLQRHGADRLRLRDFRRQPVRHSHHSFPRPAQSGQISGPLRPQPHSGQSRAQVRSRLHPRARARRRVRLHSGEVHHLSERPRLLCREPSQFFCEPSTVPCNPPITTASGDHLRLHSRRRRQLLAKRTAARTLRRRLVARFAPSHRQLRTALSEHLGADDRLGTKRGR